MRYARTSDDYQAIGVEPQIDTEPKSILIQDSYANNVVFLRGRAHAEEVIDLIRAAIDINEW